MFLLNITFINYDIVDIVGSFRQGSTSGLNFGSILYAFQVSNPLLLTFEFDL